MNVPLLAPLGVSISELKKNPSAVIAEAGDLPVAVLNRNTPAAYILSAKAWEEILDRLEDAELAAIVREREGQEEIEVSIDDL
jgi:antitoxin StbD